MPQEDVLVKRIPPNSIEAEQSVIGSMLYAPDSISEAADLVKAEDFYQRQYGIIFETIMELYQAGKTPDIITLQNALKTKDVPPEVYSVEYLRDLINSVFTSANIKAYARIVAEKALLRRMIKTFDTLENDCYLEKEDTETLVNRTEKEIFDLLEKRKDSISKPIDEITLNVLAKIEEAAKNGGGITGIPTGFTQLDHMLTGLQPSDLILVAGRPSMGKTAFALNLVDNISVKKHYRTAIFELEMSAEQLVNRMLAMEAHVDSQKLRTGTLADAEWDDIVEASSIIAQSNLIIDDTAGINVSELRSRCRRYKLEKGLDLVIIDYLQLMSGSGRASDNRQLEISEMTRSLKQLARELNVPIILLSQLSRAPEQRSDHRPQLSDLRESGAIEQDADIVIFLYRDEVYNKETEKKGIAEIIVQKQRNGPIGTVELAWLENLTKFSNLEYI